MRLRAVSTSRQVFSHQTFIILLQRFCLRRRGVEAKLIVGDRTSPPDPVLLRTLDTAHRWTKSLSAGVPLADIAREAGHHNVRIRTRPQLAYLSPKIQRAICDGQQPTDLTFKRILTRPVPLDWKHQERLYGFDLRARLSLLFPYSASQGKPL
jgi:site-specific DNA recombinase